MYVVSPAPYSEGMLGVPEHPLNLEVQKRGQKEKYARILNNLLLFIQILMKHGLLYIIIA